MKHNQPDINDPVGYVAEREYNEQLADKITLLAAQINAANYKFLKLIAEFERRSGWAEVGVKSCAHWLNWARRYREASARSFSVPLRWSVMDDRH